MGAWAVGVRFSQALRLHRAVGLGAVALLIGAIYLANLAQLLVTSAAHVPRNVPTQIVRTLDEHPSWRLIHLLGQADTDAIAQGVVERFPGLPNRYAQVTLQHQELPDLAVWPDSQAVVYMVREGDAAALNRALAKLRPGDQVLKQRDPVGGTPVWLFVPNGAEGTR
jgi:hypothetical protein